MLLLGFRHWLWARLGDHHVHVFDGCAGGGDGCYVDQEEEDCKKRGFCCLVKGICKANVSCRQANP